MEQSEWESQKAMFWVGKTVVGTVVRQARFGVFVSLEADAIGLIEVPELSEDKRLDLDENPKVGETIKAQVLGFRDRNKQIALSVRALLDAND